MKRPIPALLLLCLALLPALSPRPAAAQLEAGAAAQDITPEEFPVNLRGLFNPRPCEEVHDPLLARSLALRNGEGRVVITVVDVISIPQETADAIKAAAAEATGWRPEEMVLTGTHTHTAPSIAGDGTGPEGAFQRRAFDGVVASIAGAVSRLEPASVAFGSDEVPDEVLNRRWFLKEGTMLPNPFGEMDRVRMNPSRDHLLEPAGPVDPEVAVISLRRADGRPLGLLSNYALHYVGGIPSGQVSADYFGEFARLAPYRVAGRTPPEDFVAMLANAASGDINNSDFLGRRAPRAPFEQVRLVAAKVADASWRAIREADYDDGAAVATRERRVRLAYRKPSPEKLAEARRILTLDENEREGLPRLATHYAARTIRQAEGPDEIEVALQAVRIGGQAIVTFPFEVLVEIGLELKERSPFERTMVLGLANGSFGYLPTPEQHELGGYETWLGTNRVQKDASVILTDALLEMLGELHE